MRRYGVRQRRRCSAPRVPSKVPSSWESPPRYWFWAFAQAWRRSWQTHSPPRLGKRTGKQPFSSQRSNERRRAMRGRSVWKAPLQRRLGGCCYRPMDSLLGSSVLRWLLSRPFRHSLRPTWRATWARQYKKGNGSQMKSSTFSTPSLARELRYVWQKLFCADDYYCDRTCNQKQHLIRSTTLPSRFLEHGALYQ